MARISNELRKALREVKIHNILRRIVGMKLANKIMGWKTHEEFLEEIKKAPTIK